QPLGSLRFRVGDLAHPNLPGATAAAIAHPGAPQGSAVSRLQCQLRRLPPEPGRLEIADVGPEELGVGPARGPLRPPIQPKDPAVDADQDESYVDRVEASLPLGGRGAQRLLVPFALADVPQGRLRSRDGSGFAD